MRRVSSPLRLLAAFVAAIFAFPVHMAQAAEAPSVNLAAAGRPLHPIVISPIATPRVRAAAENLARLLGRISGAEFKVVTAMAKRGSPSACRRTSPPLRCMNL